MLLVGGEAAALARDPLEVPLFSRHRPPLRRQTIGAYLLTSASPGPARLRGWVIGASLFKCLPTRCSCGSLAGCVAPVTVGGKWLKRGLLRSR
jgi:hypothetical protein